MAEMNANTSAVVGYFATQAKAERAIDALIGAGFTSREIGVAARGSDNSTGTATSGSAGLTTAGSTGTGSASTYANKAGDVASNAGEHAESAWGKVKSFFSGGDPVEPYWRTDAAGRRGCFGHGECNGPCEG